MWAEWEESPPKTLASMDWIGLIVHMGLHRAIPLWNACSGLAAGSLEWHHCGSSTTQLTNSLMNITQSETKGEQEQQLQYLLG